MPNWLIPEEVKKALTSLENNGEKAYLVGGAVRDLVLNLQPKDWDLVTSASLEKIQQIFPANFFIGKKQETLQVRIDEFPLEISPYRDGSKTLEEDLAKRDFTINALAYDLIKNKIIDTLGGQQDLEKKLIKTQDPTARFQEDPLRMLRALRLAAQYGFTIEEKTIQAIKENSNLLKETAIERIRDELVRILLTSRIKETFTLAQQLGLLAVFLPELSLCFGVEQNVYHHLDVAGHILQVVEHIPENNLEVRLAALLHDLGKPEVKSVGEDGRIHFYDHEKVSAQKAKIILQRLRISSRVLNHPINNAKILSLVKNHMFFYPPETSEKAVRRFLSRLKPENVQEFLLLHRADILSGSPAKQERLGDVFRLEKDIAKILAQNPPLEEKDLDLTGEEIISYLGLKEGKKIGEIKMKLLKAVIEEPKLNTKEKLRKLLDREKP